MILFENELICKYCLYVCIIYRNGVEFYTNECKYGYTYWVLALFYYYKNSYFVLLIYFCNTIVA